jgi:restriction endonuclease S subunit
MAGISIVKLSEIEGVKRFDANRYRTSFLKLEKDLKKIAIIRKLGYLVVESVRTGYVPRDRDIYQDDKRIHFLKTDNLREGVIDFENSDFLPARSLSKSDYLKFKNVTVTISGVHYDIIGKAAIFLDYYPQSVTNQNIAVIKTDENLLNPFYLTIFLNSKYGRKQFWMLSRQTEQFNLSCREVEEMLIPLFDTDFQQEIETLAKNSFDLIEKAKSLYSQAEKLLLEKLGLKGFQAKYKLSYTANLSKAFGVHRIDAEYFQITYDSFMECLKEHSKIAKLKEFMLDFQKLKALYEPKVGDFLLTKDVISGIAYVVKEPVEGIAAGSILILKINENKINKEYLALCINSIIGKLQIKREGGGAIIHWRPEQIKNLQVPVLSKKVQQEISSLIKQSYETKQRARELWEEAKRKVEKAIENEIHKQP